MDQQNNGRQQQLRAVSPPNSPVAPFRSAAIQQRLQLRAAPPLLLLSPPSLQQRPGPSTGVGAGVHSIQSFSNKFQQQQQQQQESGMFSASTGNTNSHIASGQSTTRTPATSREAMVGTIPVLPGFHILERTAQKLQLPLSEQIVSLESLLNRIFTYLRINSIVVQCGKDTGCLDCNVCSLSSGSGGVEFVIQLWRIAGSSDTSPTLWLEVQRRQGCSMEMNSIRRSLLRYITNGEGTTTTSNQGQDQHQRSRFTRPRPVMTRMPWDMDPSESNRKRSRVMPLSSPPSPLPPRPPVAPRSSPSDRMDCRNQSSNDSLVITLGLLESPYSDQQRLGLESLVVISTNTSSPETAAAVSRALVVGDGPWGPRLQQRLVHMLYQLKPPLQGGQGPFFPPTTFGGEQQHQSMLYHLALQALTNALECLSQAETASVSSSLSSSFWQTTVQSLTQNLENAMALPHEAALSAKCIHHLLQLSERRESPTHHQQQDDIAMSVLRDTRGLQTATERAHEYGKGYHLALEQEAQRLLGSCNSVRG